MPSVAATPAIHFLRKHGVAFTEHPYRYQEHGGTRVLRGLDHKNDTGGIPA